MRLRRPAWLRDHLPEPGTFFATVAAAFLLGACLAASTPRPTADPPLDGAPVPDAGGGDAAPAPPSSQPPVPSPTDTSAGRVPIPPPPPPPAPPETPPAAPAPTRVRPVVRVVLAKPPAEGVTVAVAGDWVLRAGSGAVVAQGRNLRGMLLRSGGDTWLGPWRVPDAGAELTPATAGDLAIGTRRYPGTLRVPGLRPDGVAAPAPLRPQVVMDVETYLEGVVAGELPPEFPREARRAQAVVARTYLLTQRTTTWSAEWIEVDDSGLTDQEFVGISGTAAQRDAVRDAVESTRGLVVFDGARPLRTWYHSICGGHTCPSGPVFKVPQAAPLAGVPCTTCVGTKYYRWQARIAGAKVVKAAGLSGALESFRALETTPEGRALSFEIRAGGRTVKPNAAEFRLAVGPSDLRSTWLDRAEVAGGDLVVSGRGWGHGVGMCQWGAKGLADRGVAAEAIVAHYYPGADLRRAW